MKIVPFLILVFYFNPLFSQLSEVEYTIKNVRANTKYSDYGTSYFGANRVIFASSKLSRKKYNNKNDEAPPYDLFKGYVSINGEINNVKKIKNQFSNQYNESNVSFTPDLKYVYFTQNNLKGNNGVKDKNNWVNLKIYRGKVNTNGEWTNIISLPFNSDSYSCAHPSVSEDGRILFFTSDMPGTLGQSDIFWVTISKNGKYGEPQNMGGHINSEAKENFPFIDGNVLYFSSDRADTKGGLDVYRVEIDQPSSTPANLGSPVNSPYDDFCLVINRDNKTGFFSSNRSSGKGEDDIYYFAQKTKTPSCQQLVIGEIRDLKDNHIIPNATVNLYSNNNNKLLATYPTTKEGKFEFTIACKGNYRLEALKNNYKKNTKKISYFPHSPNQKVDLFLENIKKDLTTVKINKPKIEAEKEVELKNKSEESIFIDKNGKKMLNLEPIYFVLDEYYITKNSDRTLVKATKIIKDNPNIIVEIGSHTDCRASDSYNIHLSNLRAKEVVRYLMKLGVPRNRIRGRGYGESQLVNHCRDGVKCTEAEHLQNRRTEFVIIQK